jgi:membrane associated rhomboid family serine protease
MPQPHYRYTSSSSYGGFPPAVKWLIVSNTVIFLLYFLGGEALRGPLITLFALYAEAAVRNYYVWQVVTYLFLHGGVSHLVFNMLGLWFFGAQLERDWGTRRFLRFYFLCGAAAAVCVLLVNIAIGRWGVPTLGASGAILGVMVAFAVLYPDTTVIFFVFPLKAKYMVMLCIAINLVTTFGPNDGVSTVAHLGGAAFGYLYMKRRIPSFGMPDLGGAYRQWKLARAKRKFQVYMRKNNTRGPWVN